MDVAISRDVAPVIKDSINREIILLESKINLVKSEIKKFEKEYKLTSSGFLKKFEKGELGDSQDYFEWWGLIKGLKTLGERLKKANGERAAIIFRWVCAHFHGIYPDRRRTT